MSVKSLVLSRLGLGVVLIACLAALPLAAQSGDTLRVTMAQPFLIGRTLAPAGAYTIHFNDTDNEATVAEFVSDSTRFATGVVVMKVPADDDPSGKTEVVLLPAGDRYRLDKIWVAGKSYGYQVTVK